MAISANDTKATTRQPSTRRSKAAVPAASREATARKLDTAPEVEELDFEAQPETKAAFDREAEARRQRRMQEIARLEEKRDELVERLDVGAAKIEEARSQGKDVTQWEDYWITLLRQYENVCDKLRDLHLEA